MKLTRTDLATMNDQSPIEQYLEEQKRKEAEQLEFNRRFYAAPPPQQPNFQQQALKMKWRF